MCFAVTCDKCGKTTWKGCGRHVESVMNKVPKDAQCVCARGDNATPKASSTAAAADGASGTSGTTAPAGGQ